MRALPQHTDPFRLDQDQGGYRHARRNYYNETVMTREVATCKQSDTVYELMEWMASGRFRHVRVIDNGRLAGIVSIGDVVKYRLAEMAFESNALRQYIATA